MNLPYLGAFQSLTIESDDSTDDAFLDENNIVGTIPTGEISIQARPKENLESISI